MTDKSTTPPAALNAARPARPILGRLPEEIGVLVALATLMLIIGVSRPEFLNPINLLRILGNTGVQGMIALGMVFLLAIREIDLSVGWMFNFSAVVAATLMMSGLDPWIAAGVGVLFGAVVQRGAGCRAEAADHHRDARHVFDVSRPVAGG
jgi:ribose transport system permease protein